MTDLRDIGRWVARIIADPRTLNRLVFAYSEVITQHQVYETVERLSGENPENNPVRSPPKILVAALQQTGGWCQADIRG